MVASWKVRPSQPRRALSAAVLAVLVAAALISSAGAGTGDGWNQLRRPLHFPKLAHGVACPVSQIDRRVAWKRAHIFGKSGIGRGPVYPGLGFTGGVLHATRDPQDGGPWFGEKVLWYVLPSYRGPVLIRGRRLDGSQVMGFSGAKRPYRELQISPLDSVSWAGQPKGSRGIPSGVRVLTAGCYGFQIDGTSFSRIVVVTVDVTR